MKFYIKEEYLCSVTIAEHFNTLPENEEDFTAEQLIGVLQKKYQNPYTIIRTEDHPEFQKLRTLLSEQGYIKKEDKWLNGDIVLKPFFLNNVKFIKGVSFVCGAAMKHQL